MNSGWRKQSVGSFEKCPTPGTWGCPWSSTIMCRNWPHPRSPALRVTVMVKPNGEWKGSAWPRTTHSLLVLWWAHICLFVLQSSREPGTHHTTLPLRAPRGTQAGLPASALLLCVRTSLKTEILEELGRTLILIRMQE